MGSMFRSHAFSPATPTSQSIPFAQMLQYLHLSRLNTNVLLKQPLIPYSGSGPLRVSMCASLLWTSTRKSPGSSSHSFQEGTLSAMIAQRLRALAALPEDVDSIPGIHMTAHCFL